MSESEIHRLPIVSPDDVRYSHLARRVAFPPSDRGQSSEFYPAFAGFNVGSGTDVDVSFLYSFSADPKAGFDRHLRTEEMFVPLEGDLCIPLAPCKRPDDPDEQPTTEEFVCAIVPQGEAIILKPNVWHNGGWPLDPEKGVRYIMVLSGHRAGAGLEGRVDHITKRFPEGVTIIPDWGSRG